MIGIINYEAGNLASLSNALERLAVPFFITQNPKDLEKAKAVILPGVGHAGHAMERLSFYGFTSVLQQIQKPLLGICLGMQLLYDSSEEGGTECLGLIPGSIKKFTSGTQKIPHMGWNTVRHNNNPLFQNIAQDEYFYFVHSYYAEKSEYASGITPYIQKFSSIVQKGNITGIQFHPEKSGEKGELLLKNWARLCLS